MGFFLRSKQLDLETGQSSVVLFYEQEALNYGIRPGDKVELRMKNGQKVIVTSDTSASIIPRGQIGLFEEVWKKNHIPDQTIIEVSLLSRPVSIEAIKKRLLGKSLTYAEILSIIEDINNGRIGMTEMAYFIASSFFVEHSLDEMTYLTKAMAETGEMLHLPGHVIVDKHSVGGIPGNRTTMIVVPIVASYGLTIPKTSSRAITSPSGTADTMEVLSPVEFSMEKIQEIVRKTHACLIWGGGLRIAPADDHFIKVTYPLALEPYDKMIVSILAKKVAMGVRYLVLDIPYGKSAKIPNRTVAKEIEKKFIAIAKRFGIKTKVVMIPANEPVGNGVGPCLEARDVIRVLEHHPSRPRDLEKKAIILAGALLELVGRAKFGTGKAMAHNALKSGRALKKMTEIIQAQGGKLRKSSDSLTKGSIHYRIHAKKSGRLAAVDNYMITQIARVLGAPFDKVAGIAVYKKIGQRVNAGEHIATLYSKTQGRMDLAKYSLTTLNIFSISS